MCIRETGEVKIIEQTKKQRPEWELLACIGQIARYLNEHQAYRVMIEMVLPNRLHKAFNDVLAAFPAKKRTNKKTEHRETKKGNQTMKNAMKKVISVIMLAIVAGCGQVDTGEAGFFTRWGEITSKRPLEEGLHFYEPWGTDLITYDIKNQTVELKTEVFTKDVQSMKVDIAVTYNLDKDKVIELHAKTGRKYAQVLIYPSVLGATKDALGKMEAGDIVASREIATSAITKAISEKLTPHGINVVLVNIANIDYSDAFERAVEEKQVALQQSQKEKNNTARLREVAEQEVVKAEAEAKAKVLNSEAEAKAILVKAEAEAKAIDMRNKALAQSRALIEYETVKAWDGKLPVQMLGGAPVPFLRLGGKEGE